MSRTGFTLSGFRAATVPAPEDSSWGGNRKRAVLRCWNVRTRGRWQVVSGRGQIAGVWVPHPLWLSRRAGLDSVTTGNVAQERPKTRTLAETARVRYPRIQQRKFKNENLRPLQALAAIPCF